MGLILLIVLILLLFGGGGGYYAYNAGTSRGHWDRRDSSDHHCGPVRDARTILGHKLGEAKARWEPRTNVHGGATFQFTLPVGTEDVR
jgi:hypothetical protein